MTYNACNSGVSLSSWITRLTEEDRVQAVVLWHSHNPIIIINNSLLVQGNETGWYERKGTMDYAASLLSHKLHEGDKATIKNKKREIDMKTASSELCISLERAGAASTKTPYWIGFSFGLLQRQLWLPPQRRNCKDWLTMNVDGSGSAEWHNLSVPPKSVTNHSEKHTSVLWCDNTMVEM